MDPNTIFQNLVGAPLREFILLHSFWDIAMHLTASGLYERLRALTQERAGQEDIERLWLGAYRKAVSEVYDDWYKGGFR